MIAINVLLVKFLSKIRRMSHGLEGDETYNKLTVVSKNAHATSLRKRIQKYLCKSDESKIFQSLIMGVSQANTCLEPKM